MQSREERNARMNELLKTAKSKQEVQYDPNLKECIDVMLPNIEVLTEEETEEMYDKLQDAFPFAWWGRIDWDNVQDKTSISNVSSIMDILHERYGVDDFGVFVLWGYTSGNCPVIKVSLVDALNNIEDINAVGQDQWLYSPQRQFVIEFYHDGDIVIGF